MKATHQFITGEYETTAWQFNREAPIPIWVAKKFHLLEDSEGWQAIGNKGEVVAANITDWALLVDDKLIIVLTDSEFQKLFKPIPL